jgi:predicted Fe-Mo cluster-binding NifX family protein
MKLAITAQGPELKSLIDLRFGRARFFIIFETETGQQAVIDNADGINAMQGAGTQAVQHLAGLGVQTVLTGHVGPKAQNALQAARIPAFSVAGGTAEQAVKDFLEGRLQPLLQADVEGHWA